MSLSGSFDSASASLCEALAALRMTRELLLVNFPVFHHELNMLQHADVLQRIACDCDHIGIPARLDIEPRMSECPSKSAAEVVAD